jgi:hypothetical protein
VKLSDLVRVAVLGIGVIAGPAAARAQVFDLTGSWSGTIVCKIATGGVQERTTVTPTLRITQIGSAIGVRVDAVGGMAVQLAGLANPDGKKPTVKGEFALVRCGTDDEPGDDVVFDEVGRFLAATKPPPIVKATFKGTSLLSGAETVGTCTWKWTRTDATGPVPAVPTRCAP